MINIKPAILKGSWVQLEPLNESHKNELSSVAQDESIWTYNSSKAYGERFYRWFDKAINCFQSQQHLPFIVLRFVQNALNEKILNADKAIRASPSTI